MSPVPANDDHPAALTRQQVDNRTEEDFVYIIRSPDQNAFKVGYCNGTPRIHALRTGNPAKLVLDRTIAAERQCERAIHEALAAYRIRGEWFTDNGLAWFVVDELLDAQHLADNNLRLMLPGEAADAVVEAIACWLGVPDEEAAA